jgi:hypothetical protein
MATGSSKLNGKTVAKPGFPKSDVASAFSNAPIGLTAAKAAALIQMASARIDEGFGLSQEIPKAPKGFTVELTSNQRNIFAKLVTGKKAQLSVSSTTLSLTGPKGKTHVVVDGESQLQQVAKDFKEISSSLTKDDLANAFNVDWSFENSCHVIGFAGKLFSASLSTRIFSGGAHPSNSNHLATFDLESGKSLGLNEILSKAQFDAVVTQITKQLSKLKGPFEVDGNAFLIHEDLKAHIAKHFAVTGSKGKIEIHVAWESGVHALGPLQAHFIFDAPLDAAFKSNIAIR